MRWMFLLAAFLVVGCAGNVKVRQVGPTEAVDGVRFYRPAPYVWITEVPPSEKVNVATEQTTTNEPPGQQFPKERKVTTATGSIDKRTTYKIEFVYLPDPSQEYIIQWKSGWIGSIHPKFTLTDGWNLASFEANINTGLTASISLQGTLSHAVKGMVAGFEGPGLYKLKFDPDKEGWTLGERVIFFAQPGDDEE